MKNSNLISIAVIFFGGALTAFLWFPLLPLVVPLVTFAIGARWTSATLDSEAQLGKRDSRHQLLYFPPPQSQFTTTQASKPTAWSPSANLLTPARAGSLPSLSDRKEKKNFRRQLRESRQVARLLQGFNLRNSSSEI